MKYADQFRALKTRKSYDEQNALSLAVACDLAYADENTIAATVNSWSMQLIAVINKRKGLDIDTQCYLMRDDENIIVVFRGSDSGADWFANFQATQDPGPLDGTGAHEGFQDALYPAVIALTRHLGDASARGQRIWITGHSLGGALCSLYAGMLIENGIEVYGIYTFASPRPGSPDFQKQLNKLIKGPHFRVVNDGDIVPHLPPEPFFSHPGSRIILKTRRKEKTKSSWMAQRIASLRHFVKVTGEKFDVADNHRLSADAESYIPRLIADLKRNRK
ncbi:MAG: lipase family protein [Pseudomonadales bacterium]|nr:lipase family protein [Pseudomonadales bacterium]